MASVAPFLLRVHPFSLECQFHGGTDSLTLWTSTINNPPPHASPNLLGPQEPPPHSLSENALILSFPSSHVLRVLDLLALYYCLQIALFPLTSFRATAILKSMLPGPQPPSQQGCPWPSSWKPPSFFEDVNTELIVFFSNLHLALSLGNFSHHADSPFGSGPSIPVLVHLHWFHHRSVSSKLSQSHILNLIIT